MPHLVLPVSYSMKSLSATLLNKDDDYRILGNHHGDVANEKLTSQKINAIFFNYFAIIQTSSICTKWPNYPGAELVGKAFKFSQRKGYLSSCVRS